jgi:vancomycin resistance protein VanW
VKALGILALAILPLAVLMARPGGEHCLGSYATTLDGRTRSQKHNAQLSMERLNGYVIQPGETFSFNKVVGSFSRDAGYRKAPVSYNGQLIDSWGGGVCQTSTTLYNAALLSGMEIVERNRHRFAPSYVPPGRDAAVAIWNIDLRFRNPHPYPVRILGRFEGERLLIGLYGREALQDKPQVYEVIQQVQSPMAFSIGPGGRTGRVRNTGKQGCDVSVYRVIAGRKERISSDHYPVMNRIVDYR